MMRRMRAGGAPGPGRRALLAGVLASPALLAGCGIRLEEDAPPVPLVPTREPLPGEDALTALTRACAELADGAEAVPGAVAGALVPVHRRQHTVLRTTLVRLGVPVEVVDAIPTQAAGTPSPSAGTPSPSASPSAGATPGAKAARTALGEVEGDAALGVRGFTDIAEELRDTVLSLHAQRFAAAVLLTGSGPDVTGGPVTSGIVEQLAGRTEAARYFLQVVAARSSGRARTRATTTLSALDQILSEQVSEGSAPPESLGVPLPFEVETAADATRLARRALGELRGAYGPRLGALREEHGADGWAATTRWLGAVEAECHRWGLTLQPFPGLT